VETLIVVSALALTAFNASSKVAAIPAALREYADRLPGRADR
jgi:hypothetical protein